LPLSELRILGIAPESVPDFSTNVNPYGPSPRAPRRNRCSVARSLSRPGVRQRARAALPAALDVAKDRIVLGNGASELLWTLAGVFTEANTKVLIVEPAFGELHAAATSLRREIHAVVAQRERG